MGREYFFQLFEKESSTFTYILGDLETGEAVIIDPVKETVDRDLQILKEAGLKCKYVIETHIHADHITSSSIIREKTGAKIAIGRANQVKCADKHLADGDELKVGGLAIKCIETPGHTHGCMSFHCGKRVFTGDTLMIRGCGRADFQSGSTRDLFHSVREKLFSLPDDTEVYPGHDYKGRMNSYIGLEKLHNPRLGLEVSFEEFDRIMANLNLSYPKKIDVALPANQKCGLG